MRVAFVVAGTGYGKSTLADELVSSLDAIPVRVSLAHAGDDPEAVAGAVRSALRAAGSPGLAEAVDRTTGDEADAESIGALLSDHLAERTEPFIFIVDDAHGVEGPGARALASLVTGIPSPHRVVILGRSVPDEATQAGPDALRLTLQDLRLTVDEVTALGGLVERPIDRVAAARITAANDGWPLAVDLVLRSGRWRSDDDGSGLEGLVEGLLDGLDDETRDAACHVAHAPLLSADVAEAAGGPDALQRIIGAGIPIRERADGWLEIPEPIRTALARRASLPGERAARVAAAYVESGDLRTAIAFHSWRGDDDATARLITARPANELQALEPAELRAAVGGLPDDVIDRHPGLLLALARVAESVVQVTWRRQLLDRLRAMPAIAADPVLRREVEAELATDLARDGLVDEVIESASGLLAAAKPAEHRTRALAMAASGRAKAFQREPAAMVEAAEMLTEAAAGIRAIGDRELLGRTLQRLGYDVHFAVGDLDRAIAALQEAAELAPLESRTRAGVITFLADALVYSGQLDEAEVTLREALAVGQRLRDHRILGYHAWMRAGIASRRGDAAGVAAWLAEGERHPGDWFAHPTGIEFLADGVDYLGRVGAHDDASRYLTRVEERCAADGRPGIDEIALVARAIHGARAGDPAGAETELVACLDTYQLPPREGWRIHLLRGLAALRGGDRAAAGRHAARGFEGAVAMGHPDLPRIHEPAATMLLMDALRPDAGAAPIRVIPTTPHLSVRVLGGFEVTADGHPADPPPGRPQMLVKLLAIAGGPMASDDAIEALWPEVDPETGRVRLRNVLARIRATSGDLVRRSGEALVLDPDVDVDLAAFEADARAALAAPADREEVAARRAVARYTGELLPADRYADFAAGPRERAAARYVSLLDRLATAARIRGDIDEALHYHEEAIAAEPLEEGRYEVAAGIASEHGRRDRARRLIERSLAVVADLGVDPSDAIAGLARDLGIPITTGSAVSR